ncbi:Uncharacterised protein [Mycobacteroides abscessus subsp. abscessus]|nr:Uncharacterised protein [Mycobacteroides abscessus subsp. abscessus]
MPGAASPPPYSAPMAPQLECPHTTTQRTFSSSRAKTSAASTEASPVAGTRLPTLRTVNRSPGPLLVMTFGTMRESEQVRKNESGSCRWTSSSRWRRTTCAWLRW